jgi:hypothetical protein
VKRAQAETGYSTNTDQAGNKALTGIFFRGRKDEISIAEANAATATPSDKTQGSN